MITSKKANLLFSLEKKTEECRYVLPNPEEVLSIELLSVSEHYQNEIFSLDINRKYLTLSKKTFQKRVQQNIVLRRIDFNAGHINPMIGYIPDDIDARTIALMKKYENKRFQKETHIHFYIEGYGEKWAFPISEFGIISTDTLDKQVKEFCKYCNIVTEIEFHQKDLLCMA